MTAATIAPRTAGTESQPLAVARGRPVRVPVSPPRTV